MNKQEFINSIKEEAMRGQREYGILASLTIAQAILESGWGKSQLAVKANNLFGIKAFSNWKGKRITMATTEWYDGQKQVVNAEFRAYDSFNDSIEDHNKLLLNTSYEAVRKCKDYKAASSEIYKCGYATDPKYTEKLISIIEEYKLYEFDDNNAIEEVAAGNETNKIKEFQHLCNVLGTKDYEGKPLNEDNCLGPRTKSSISKLPVLKEGSRGNAVVFIQKVVGAVPVDGIYGAITKKGVLEYQRSKGIKVDGVVGRETWVAIIKELGSGD
jgi:Muramidase (flagellum-specific)